MGLYLNPVSLGISQHEAQGFEKVNASTLEKVTKETLRAVDPKVIVEAVKKLQESMCTRPIEAVDTTCKSELLNKYEQLCKQGIEVLDGSDSEEANESSKIVKYHLKVSKLYAKKLIHFKMRYACDALRAHMLQHLDYRSTLAVLPLMDTTIEIKEDAGAGEATSEAFKKLPDETQLNILRNPIFLEYCQMNPNSFMNQVCMQTLLRKGQKIDENDLERILSDYVDFKRPVAFQRVLKADQDKGIDDAEPSEIDLIKEEANVCFQNLTGDEFKELFPALEKYYHEKLAPAYEAFFTFVLNYVTIDAFPPRQPHPVFLKDQLGITDAEIADIRNPVVLGRVIQKFHEAENQEYLLGIRDIRLADVELSIMPPEIKQFKNLQVVSLSKTGTGPRKLDLRQNNALFLVRIEGGVRQLFFGNNDRLKEIFIKESQLDTLDVSQSPYLEKVLIENKQPYNFFCEYDFSNNPKLKELQLLNTHGKKLTLNNPELERITLGNSHFEEVDLTSCTSLDYANLIHSNLKRAIVPRKGFCKLPEGCEEVVKANN